jgi:DNA-binding CsgD family transcriptional regulator
MAPITSGNGQGAGQKPGVDGSDSNPGQNQADINFATIMGLDSVGGWHILHITEEGAVTADTAALKVLRQFFPGEPVMDGRLPSQLAGVFYESRDWGMGRALSRTWRRCAFVKSGLKLTAHFVPGQKGGYVLLKTGPVNQAADASALPLTPREQEIVSLVAAGRTNGEIGLVLSISARTVQKHLENIFRKLGVETRTGLAMRLAALQPDAGG